MTTSVRVRLLKWLITPLLVVNLLGAGLTYWLAWIPAEIAFDQSLADAAWAILPRLRNVNRQVNIDLPREAEQVLRVDHFDLVYFCVRDDQGRVIAGDADFPAGRFPADANQPLLYDGVMRGEPVRFVEMKADLDGVPAWIGIAETLRKRHSIQSRILFSLLVLELILTGLAIVIAWVAVSRGLRPISALKAELDKRHFEDLSPLHDNDVPDELKPMAGALNALLDRAADGTRAQQDFLANVAHQLRTPLAGLRAQLEWVGNKFSAEPALVRSVAMMMSSVERLTRQGNQLLALARAEPSRFEKKRREPVRLDEVVSQTVQHFVAEADKKDIDLGFELQAATVLGDRFLLHDLVDNLVDNAIRYAPRGGQVTLRLSDAGKQVCLEVEDNGPGIPGTEQEKIFNRFYRIDSKVSGSGLGLAIVRDIARDHDADIALASPGTGQGTVFKVLFPPAASQESRKPVPEA
ncbi:sensor histidine kinase [Noviherbaspirillum galbum]|uniref:histidine kinase n=1 Tax=Noviherbaspirillum galbum TaxID=2709383 RepID=A0A6B3SY50_9BURK|nr:sensor histidine kinase [Noviherbaspirillum galbum]NEX64605.1 sensor histidine kinase [Noviherbaspirillum galbum]